MNREAVILDNAGDVSLILESVQPQTGAPKSGWVVNGAWYWRREGTTEYALRDKRDSLDDAVTVWEREPPKWLGIRRKKKVLPVSSFDEADDIPF